MALLWLALAVVLSSRLGGSRSQPLGRRSFLQDAARATEAAPGLPAEADSPAPTQRRWEWKGPGDEGHRTDPRVARRRREEGLGGKKSSVPAKEQPKKRPPAEKAPTARPSALMKKTVTGPPPPKKAAQGVATVTPTTPKTGAPSQALGTSPKAGKVSVPKDGVPRGNAPKVAPQGTSGPGPLGKETPTAASLEPGKLSRTTEDWPWLRDQTSAAAPTSAAAAELPAAAPKRGSVASEPPMKSKERHWWTTRASEERSDVPAATRKRGSTTAGPHFETKAGFEPKRGKASPTTTLWPWLDDASTASSQTLVDISDASTETPGVDPGRPSLTPKRKGSFFPATTVAGPTPAAPGKAPGAPATVVGKCLLALLLLALVAAVFIAMTGVLGALLWRQKRAYKMQRPKPAEMVCISSLLAAEEAEEATGRAPRVRRAKGPRENGSEAEADNLTLNSFLPDH